MGPTTAAAQSAAAKNTTPPNDGLSDILFGKKGAAAAVADSDAEDDTEADDESDDDSTENDDDNAEAADGLDDDDAGDDDSEDDDATAAKAKDADAEEDDDATEDDDADDEDDEESPAAKAARAKLNAEQQTLFNRAMKKERERRQSQLAERDTRIAQLEKEVAEKSTASTATPTAADPLADVDSEAELEKRIDGAKAWRKWLRTHPDGGTIGEGDKAQEVTAEQARDWLIHYEDILMEHAPARRATLAKRQAADAEALKLRPWLGKAADPRTIAVEAELRATPALRSIPGIRALIADAHITRAARAAKKAAPAGGSTPAAGKTGAAARAPINPGAGGARPPKASRGKATTKINKTLEDTGEDPGDAALRNALFPGGDS